MSPIRIVAYNMSLLRSSGLWSTFRLFINIRLLWNHRVRLRLGALRLSVSVANVDSSTDLLEEKS
jgi:hypothetical protein